MKKTWIWIGGSLILIGLLLFGGAMMGLKWDFKELSTIRHETNRYEFQEAVRDISVSTRTAELEIVPSETGTLSVVCHEQEKVRHEVTVRDGVLRIAVKDTRKWYEYLGIDFGNKNKITLALPEGSYGDLSVEGSTGRVKISSGYTFAAADIAVSTGDVEIDGVKAQSLAVKVSTGKVTLSSVLCEGEMKLKVSTGDTVLNDVSCQAFFSEGTTGDLTMKNLMVKGLFKAERNTGDVLFEKCDAAELEIENDTGHVKGSLCSDKIFKVTTDTGKTEVPDSLAGGRCEIETDTGDIKITVEK